MNIFNGKGMSINVNLSDDQMEQLASLTADKVNTTRTHYMNETEVLQREVQDLRRELERRDTAIVEDLMRDNSYRELYIKLKEKYINQINDLKRASDLHLHTILELQRLQTLVSPIDDENRTIGVVLNELESKFQEIHNDWEKVD